MVSKGIVSGGGGNSVNLWLHNWHSETQEFNFMPQQVVGLDIFIRINVLFQW